MFNQHEPQRIKISQQNNEGETFSVRESLDEEGVFIVESQRKQFGYERWEFTDFELAFNKYKEVARDVAPIGAGT